jgi:hypothetical protein
MSNVQFDVVEVRVDVCACCINISNMLKELLITGQPPIDQRYPENKYTTGPHHQLLSRRLE